jgi:conserved domain protein
MGNNEFKECLEMIKVYGKENCSKCTSLKGILTDRNIEFEYIEDVKTLMIVASKARIMSAPVIEYNDTVYSMEAFLKVI